MSVLDDVLEFFGLGGGDEVTAVATSGVEVNPQVTSINIIDTEGLQDVISGLGAVLAGQVAAGQEQVARLENARVEDGENLRLLLSGAALVVALSRK